MWPDYTLNVVSKDFNDYFGLDWKGVGWYNSGDDWLLATWRGVKSDVIRVDVWNNHDPRQDITDLLSLNCHTN